MSVTGHRDVRHPDDFYETPAWCVRALLPYLQRGDVLDPCCGNGAIGRVLAEEWSRFNRYGIEINEGRYLEAAASTVLHKRDGVDVVSRTFDNVTHEDYLALPSVARIPLIVTNPPFKLALEFATKALKEADTVAFLLRLNWLASETRRKFHEANPCDLIVMPRRPSFAQFCSCGKSPNCGWKATLPASEPRPSHCNCGGPIKVSTTDSTEYAWFVWGPGRGNRYEIAGNRFAIDWAQVKREVAIADKALDDAAEGA